MGSSDVRVRLAISDDREHVREIRSTVDGGYLADEPAMNPGNEPRLSHMSMNERAFPIIGVESVDATRIFYEALGFAQTYRFPSDGEPEYLTMSRGASSIGIGAVGAADEDRFGFWVYVDDVDATLERLRATGAQVVAEPEDQPWGERVARVRDPGGTLVYLGATISQRG